VKNGKIGDATLELLSEARHLADKRETELSVVLLGHDIGGPAEELSHYDADRIIYADSPRFSGFREEVLTEEMVRLIKKYKPEIILGSATGQGRSLMPRIAVSCKTGLTADCTSLDIEEETGILLQTRPAFGGNLFATIVTGNRRPQMATVRPHVFEKAHAGETAAAELVREDSPGQSLADALKKIIQETPKGIGSGAFTNSHIIIAGGRGVRGKEGFDLLRQFADLTGAAVGATRAAVDLGWIPHEHQIGQTGATVRSKIYIACGVSGQIQHLVGMQNCECVISINTDKNAPITDVADIAIVGDLFEVLPQMISFVKREKGITI
jgi:electron transfer flavoprotein alpha subunit